MPDAIAMELSPQPLVGGKAPLVEKTPVPAVKPADQKGGIFSWLKWGRGEQGKSNQQTTLESLAKTDKAALTEQATPEQRKQLWERFYNSKAGKFTTDYIVPMVVGGAFKQGANALLMASGVGWGAGIVSGGVWGAFHSGVKELNTQEQHGQIKVEGLRERANLLKRMNALKPEQRDIVKLAMARGAIKGAAAGVIGGLAADWLFDAQTADAKVLNMSETPASDVKNILDQARANNVEIRPPGVSGPSELRPGSLMNDPSSPFKIDQPTTAQSPIENPLLGNDQDKAEMAARAIEVAKEKGLEVRPSEEFLSKPLPTPIENLSTMNPDAPNTIPTAVPEPATAPTLSSELKSFTGNLSGSESAVGLSTAPQINSFSVPPTGVSGPDIGPIETSVTPPEPVLAQPPAFGHDTASDATGSATNETPLTGDESKKAEMAAKAIEEAKAKGLEAKPSEEFLKSGFPDQNLDTMNPDAGTPSVDQGAVSVGGSSVDQPTSNPLPPTDTAREEMEKQVLEQARKNNVTIKPPDDWHTKPFEDTSYTTIQPDGNGAPDQGAAGSTADGMKPLSPNTEDFGKEAAERMGVPEKLQPLFNTIKETGGVVASSDGPSGNARDLLIAAVGPDKADTITTEEIDRVAKLIMMQNDIGGAYGLNGATPATEIASGRVLKLNDEILDILKKKAA